MANKKRKPTTEIPKKRINKKLISVIVITVLAVAIILSSLFVIDGFAPANPKVYDRWVLSAFNGSYDGEDTPNSFYQVEIKKDVDSGANLYSCVDLKLSTTNSRNISEIWINISDLYEDELNIFLSKGTASTTRILKEVTLSASDISADEDGWFRIYNNQKGGLEYNVSGFYGELKIGFSANIKLREVVVLDVNKEVFSQMNVEHCSFGVKPGYDEKGEPLRVSYTDKFEPSTAKNVVDESDKFPFAKAKDEHTH